MNKRKLLEDLQNTWCKLAPSHIQGVGVFAIRDIPKGTHPFTIGKDDWIDISKKDLRNVPREVLDLIETYCTFQNGMYNIPAYGFKIWDMVDFLNHSKNPNVISVDNGEDFVTIRKIKKGGELLIDYNAIDEHPKNYYRK